MSAARSLPAFSDRDDELDDGESDPFSRCEHALNALRAGDVSTALATLDERYGSRDLADVIAGEAASLIRAGLLSDAERRLECVVEPKFGSRSAARSAYAKAITATRHARLVAILNAQGLEFAA